MADIKISELPAANPLDKTEILELVQGAVSKSATIQQLIDAVNSGIHYAQLVGDGVAVNISVAHNLNTRDVHVTTRRSTTPYDQVIVDNEATDANHILLKFGAVAPSTDSFRVTVSR